MMPMRFINIVQGTRFSISIHLHPAWTALLLYVLILQLCISPVATIMIDESSFSPRLSAYPSSILPLFRQNMTTIEAVPVSAPCTNSIIYCIEASLTRINRNKIPTISFATKNDEFRLLCCLRGGITNQRKIVSSSSLKYKSHGVRHNEKNKKLAWDKPYITEHNATNATKIKNDNASNALQKLSRKQWGVSLSLSFTYFTVMGAKCALPAVFSLITSPNSGLKFPTSSSWTPETYMARLLILSTLCIASGKLVLGPLIDTIGGIRAIQTALGLLGCSMLILSFNQSFTIFAILWMIIDFVFGSCWAASINTIQQIFDGNEQYSRQIQYIAASGRIGNAVAFALFAATIQYFQTNYATIPSWRPVFALSAIAQLIPLSMITYFANQHDKLIALPTAMSSSTSDPLKSNVAGKNNERLQHRQQKENVKIQLILKTLRAEILTFEFWLYFINRSVLTVFASFLMFVPTLLTSVYGTSSSVASQVGSLYALGCLLSLTFGAPIYSSWGIQSRLSNRLIANTILLFIGATGCSILQLGHMLNMWKLSTFLCSISFFLWGLSFAIPFYIPSSLYALRSGEASATIADLFDMGGFFILAIFNGYVASIPSKEFPSAWIRTFQITTLCSLISYISLTIGSIRECKAKRV